ncbi:MAG: hypothetical protein BGO45_04405 [Microbacterium sp. 71-36]|uniref:DUF1028 domain-containing protein n=3 Tax=Microbacterium TaxID=33882 RepID=UPI00086DF47D|nr:MULTISPECIES: DUF1028 domain-containing protein [unclassified Microbacterium]MBN9212640.1 DUF1028 domain-containing protein [Microbacterium sp.]ODU51482.1 MAG: hypothetical protein ABT07_02465 [Microbacterium sp. SCN 70-10]OJV75745.1 MAG: hypothetical protein BGO45_04405 [Microbacterium sp. 71-36]
MTFTVLARDPRDGLIGAATASRSLAVGAGVLAVAPGVGVVASQAWTNRALRGRLLTAMGEGRSAADAVASTPDWDDGHNLRQVAALGWSGAGAARSGADITAWAGERTTSNAVFVGNLLAGPDVLAAMVAAWGAGDGDLADRLLAVLSAGEDAGGDARGRQSAALVIASRDDVVLDLRVDDHADPLQELARLRRLAAGADVPTRAR